MLRGGDPVSAEVTLTIRCDHDDARAGQCGTEWGHPVAVANHTELRRHLKERGWRRTRDGRDLCPRHAPAPA
jgi:hypothetical protein